MAQRIIVVIIIVFPISRYEFSMALRYIAKNGDELKTGFNKFAKDINKVATPDTPDNPNGGNTNGNGEVKSPKTGNTFGAALVLIGMACGISMLVIYSKKRVD